MSSRSFRIPLDVTIPADAFDAEHGISFEGKGRLLLEGLVVDGDDDSELVVRRRFVILLETLRCDLVGWKFCTFRRIVMVGQQLSKLHGLYKWIPDRRQPRFINPSYTDGVIVSAKTEYDLEQFVESLPLFSNKLTRDPLQYPHSVSA
mmetsp:Transcript_24565/g.58284  ORF Transcript_24565/g.58284 Transcript_24565/m.58284 type:complete len:148 (-) Transcript_24565:257-700(-)